MKCSVCGRELKNGQMFCQCGNTVGDMNGAGALDVNRDKRSALLIIFGALAGFLVLAVIAIIFVTALIKGGSQMNDRDKWENISKPTYSITLPGNMNEVDLDPGYVNMQHLDSYRSNDAVVCISSMTFTEDQKRWYKRKKVVEMLKQWTPKDRPDLEAQEHGELVYFSYPEQVSGVFFGSDQLQMIEAFYVSNDGIYAIEIVTPQNKFDAHQDSVFAWLDSFRPKSQ